MTVKVGFKKTTLDRKHGSFEVLQVGVSVSTSDRRLDGENQD